MLLLFFDFFAGQITEAECKAALDGERANVALARHCVAELGGVPSMLAPFDSTNRPEEKVERNSTRTDCSLSKPIGAYALGLLRVRCALS